MRTKKEQILSQFRNLLAIGEVTSAARVFWDWAYMYREELLKELDLADFNIAQAVTDRVLDMSGDHTDQP